jgi:hypothetical protein
LLLLLSIVLLILSLLLLLFLSFLLLLLMLSDDVLLSSSNLFFDLTPFLTFFFVFSLLLSPSSASVFIFKLYASIAFNLFSFFIFFSSSLSSLMWKTLELRPKLFHPEDFVFLKFSKFSSFLGTRGDGG